MSTYIMMGLIVLFLLLGIIIMKVFDPGVDVNKTYDNDWKTEVKKDIRSMQEDLSRIEKKKQSELDQQDYSKQAINQQQISKLQLYLKENVKPAAYNNFFDNLIASSDLMNLIVIMVVVISSSLMSREHQQGTIKLLLIRPASRIKIFFSKWFLAVVTSIIFVVFLYGVTAVIGFFTTKMNPTNQFIYSNADKGKLVLTDFWPFLFKTMAHDIIYVMIFATIAYCLSVLFRNTALSLGITLGLVFFSGLITAFVAGKTDLVKYIWPANWSLNQYMYRGSTPPIDDMTYWFSFSYNIIALFVIILVTALIFKRRDVAN